MKENNLEKKFVLTIGLFFLNLLLPNIFAAFSLECPIWTQLIVSIIIIGMFFVLYKDDYKNSITDFLKKPFKYIGIALLAFIIYFVINIAINSVISYVLNISVPNNSSSDELFRTYPVYFVLLTLFISPVLESTFIPLSFNKILKNKVLYYVVCSILYGTLYVVFSLKTPAQLLFILSYAVLGFIISYLYNKYNNILLPILFKVISGLLFLLTYLM